MLAAAAKAAAGEADLVEQPWSVTGRVASIVGKSVTVDADGGGRIVADVRGGAPREGAWVRLSGREDAPSWKPLREREEVERLVLRLAGGTLKEKDSLQRRIREAGWAAFPVLIAHLDDARVYEKGRDVQNYMGLPERGPLPKPVLADVTVGEVCADLLGRMLIPRYRSPHERVFKPRGEMLVVRDWRAWWRKNHSKTLARVHKELEPLVDRYYKSGGDPQVIDDARRGLAAMLDQDVTLEGTAADQKLGAVLLTGDGVVWIDGLESWPSGYYKGGRDGRRLRVKGRLVEREDLPVFESPPAGGLQRSGVPVPAGTDLRKASRRFVLTKASWEDAPAP
ncbi:MAG: hypothetical protein HY927_02175 [Elusimicrobia bacterium]|nr:hypothetical protein [Elusimicrobiota bacterium]